jgi:RHS repeat-associated protein
MRPRLSACTRLFEHRLPFGRGRLRIAIALAASCAVAVVGLPTAAIAGSASDSTSATTTAQGVASTDSNARPDELSAQIAARNSGQRVEITSARTEASRTYANPDGSLTVDSYSGVHWVQQAGQWVNVDPTLSTVDGAVAPKATKANLSFSDGGGNTIATLTKSGRSVGFNWASKLPTPQLSGATARYVDVVPGIDITATATPTGYEVNLIIKSRSAIKSLMQLPLALKGLSAARQADGGLLLTTPDGSAIARTSPPVMWDASKDPATGLPLHVHTVGTSLDTTSGTTLQVQPDVDWLTDPSTVYPVTIDPATQLDESLDTYVVNNSLANTNYQTSSDLYVGYNSTYGTISRSYLKFNDSGIKNKHILSATLNLAQNVSVTCTAKTTNVLETTSNLASGATWNTQPGRNATIYGSTTSNRGTYNGTACASDKFVNIGVTSLVSKWAGNTNTQDTLALVGASETDGTQFKIFYSGDTFLAPHVSITYNSYPGTPAGRSVTPCVACTTGPVMTSSLRPKLTGGTSDPDGSALRYDFQVWKGSAPNTGDNTQLVTTGSVSNVTSGSTASWQVPAGTLTEGQVYSYRVRAYDGTDYGPWSSGWTSFSPDVTAPAAPVITSDTYGVNGWSSATSGTMSWTDTATDIGSYSSQLDGGTWTTPSTTTSRALSGLSSGWHTVAVKATDKAGNTSNASFSFGVGNGQLTSPNDQDITQERFVLQGAGPSGRDYISYKYRLGTTAPFTDVPATDVTYPGTTNNPTFPVARSGSTFPQLVWDLGVTLNHTDGPVQIEACFATSPADSSPVCSAAVTGILNTSGAGSDTTSFGPGSLNLLTGDESVSANDVSLPTYNGSLSVGRTATTLHPSDGVADSDVFGPGWVADLPGPSVGAGSKTLLDNSSDGYVTLTDPDGSQEIFLADGDPSVLPATFSGQADAGADGSILTKTSSTSFTLTGGDGTQTAWTNTAGSWAVSSVTEAGGEQTSYSYDGSGRVTRILGPVPDGVSCASPLSTPGCRTLTLTYSSVPAGGGSATRLTAVSFTAYDPASSQMSTIAVAGYAYDSNGRLAAAWDPRLDKPDSTHLATNYTYVGTTGRLATITPPGLATWTLNYDGAGRVSTVSRPDPSGPTATQTAVYDVPFTGSGAPIELGTSTTATWAQTTDLPAVGTAIFPASHAPAGTTAGAVASADWPYAQLTYLDPNGRSVNTASYGAGAWQIATTTYDEHGNIVRQLTPGNRNNALDPNNPAGVTGSTSADRALALDTTSVYNADGTEEVATYGPQHTVTLDDGSSVLARAHTQTAYDENAPTTGGPYLLPTTTIGSAQTPDGVDHDLKTTKLGYGPVDAGDTTGWTLHLSTSSTTVMGGSNSDLVTYTRYNSAGQIIETRSPKALPGGGDAHSQLTTYYTASGSGTCGGQPADAGLVCTTSPAVQPTGGDLPVTTTVYNLYGSALSTTQAIPVSGGTATRTTTATYDSADRATSVAVSTSAPTGYNAGDQVETTTYTYDADTGLPITVSTPSGGMHSTYDSLGRVSSVSSTGDATTNAVNTYDLDGHLLTQDDGLRTTSYTYDGVDEHRGLVTGINAGTTSPGSFTGSYDADGHLITQTYPNGLIESTGYDAVGSAVNLSYAKPGNSIPWITDTRASSITNQVRTEGGSTGMQTFNYDTSGRLVRTADEQPGNNPGDPNICTIRGYSYDPDGNRTGLSTTSGAVTDETVAGCATSGSTNAVSRDYDAADRLVGTGYSYDPFGRTLTVPAQDAGGTATSYSYYSTDMISGQTAGNSSRSYSLDPLGRISGWTDATGGVQTGSSANHYTNFGDNAAWISSGGGWTRNVSGLDGNLAAIESNAGDVLLQLVNLHGDVIATADDSTSAVGPNSLSSGSDEFGNTRSSATAIQRYGWLGGDLRSADALGGSILMGKRVYQPALGRFLQTDPIQGGSLNAYDYADQDPVNVTDVSGLYASPPDTGCSRCNTGWAPTGDTWVQITGWYMFFGHGTTLENAMVWYMAVATKGWSIDKAWIQFRKTFEIFYRWNNGALQFVVVETHLQERMKLEFAFIFLHKQVTWPWWQKVW